MNRFGREIIRQVKRTVQMVTGFSSVRAFFNDCASLVQLWASWRRKRYSSIAVPTVVTLVVALIYVIFPFDLLPDIFPLIGWVDDMVVIRTVVEALKREIAKFRIWQNWVEETADTNATSHT